MHTTFYSMYQKNPPASKYLTIKKKKNAIHYNVLFHKDKKGTMQKSKPTENLVIKLKSLREHHKEHKNEKYCYCRNVSAKF